MKTAYYDSYLYFLLVTVVGFNIKAATEEVRRKSLAKSLYMVGKRKHRTFIQKPEVNSE